MFKYINKASRLYNGLDADQKGCEAKPAQTGNNELAPNRWTVVQDNHVQKEGKSVRRFVKQEKLAKTLLNLINKTANNLSGSY